MKFFQLIIFVLLMLAGMDGRCQTSKQTFMCYALATFYGMIILLLFFFAGYGIWKFLLG